MSFPPANPSEKICFFFSPHSSNPFEKRQKQTSQQTGPGKNIIFLAKVQEQLQSENNTPCQCAGIETKKVKK